MAYTSFFAVELTCLEWSRHEVNPSREIRAKAPPHTIIGHTNSQIPSQIVADASFLSKTDTSHQLLSHVNPPTQTPPQSSTQKSRTPTLSSLRTTKSRKNATANLIAVVVWNLCTTEHGIYKNRVKYLSGWKRYRSACDGTRRTILLSSNFARIYRFVRP